MSNEEQQEIQLELKRIYDYLEPKIAPKDKPIVLWAFGLDTHSTEDDNQAPLFV